MIFLNFECCEKKKMRILTRLLNKISGHKEIWETTFPIVNENYLPSQEIVSFLKSVSGSTGIEYKKIGTTSEGREIPSVFIGNLSVQKPLIIIEAGVQGRDKISSAAALFLIGELAKEKRAEFYIDILEKVDLGVVPLLNPDGYQYAIFTDENWTKNRNETPISSVTGVDISRNFSHQWGEGGIELDPESAQYCGPKAFSEEESRSMRDYVLDFGSRPKIYLSIQSPLQSIVYPWAYEKTVPEDNEELERIALKVKDTIRKKFCTDFHVGQSSYIKGSTSGTSIDWAKESARIKYSYSISLPGPQFLFDVPPEFIPRFGKYLLEMIRIFADEIKINKKPDQKE